MVTQFNGIPGANVTITGGSGDPIPNSSQTRILKYIASTAGSAETIHTVTTGKTFHLQGIGFDKVGTAAIQLMDSNGSTVILTLNVTTTSPHVESQVKYTYASTVAIKINGTSGGTAYIYGTEV